jgi:hypothetical protein
MYRCYTPLFAPHWGKFQLIFACEPEIQTHADVSGQCSNQLSYTKKLKWIGIGSPLLHFSGGCLREVAINVVVVESGCECCEESSFLKVMPQ